MLLAPSHVELAAQEQVGRNVFLSQPDEAKDDPVATAGSRRIWAGRGGTTPSTWRSTGAAESLNLSGYCQRLLTSDLDQSERILDPAERA